MSSSLGLLAYVFRESEHPSVTKVRLAHAHQHMQEAHRQDLTQIHTGNRHSGLVGWMPNVQPDGWPSHEKRGTAMTSWLHIPAAAGGPESDVTPWAFATELLSGALRPSTLGGPAAVARWENGRLELMNDVLGLVRLFHYRLDDGDVWATRQGLAHVFMAEEPVRNALAWAGMAGLGWAPGGSTHLGLGRQLAGASRVHAGFRDGKRYVCVENNFADWYNDSRARSRPTASATVSDMGQYMRTAQRWPRQVVADLSGGKDSRVVAALGIRSSSIAAVRTVNTDPGEVAIAKQLMAAAGHPVRHDIEQPTSKGRKQVAPFRERLASYHSAFEGRYLAPTAFNGSPFSGFASVTRPRFNGLGGEVLAGGNYSAKGWRQKMVGAPTEAARTRLAGMSGVGLARSDTAAERVAEFVAHDFVNDAEMHGAKSAAEVLDLFYALDKMPNWSITFATQVSICPLFSPCALVLAAHSSGDPMEPGELHRQLVAEAIPEWKNIPFFKPSFATRATQPVWSGSEWSDIRSYMKDEMGGSDAFSEVGIVSLIDEIEEGRGKRLHEESVMRFLWDRTFDVYLDQVRALSRTVRSEIQQAIDMSVRVEVQD